MQIFTSYHPAIISLQALASSHPSALNMYVFCNDGGLKAYSFDGLTDSNINLQTVDIEGLKVKLQSLRTNAKDIYWGDKDDLPLVKRNKRSIKQISIDDEIAQNVLLFSIPSTTDEQLDVFAIEFPKSLSNFYLQSGRNNLSSEGKKSIGNLIRNQIKWIYSLHQEQQKNIRHIQIAYQSLKDENIKLQESLLDERIKNTNYLEEYLREIIQRYEIQFNCSISLHPEIIQQIRDLGITIQHLDDLFSRSIQTAIDLSIGSSAITVSPELIRSQFNEKAILSPNSKSHKLIQLDKTMAILDRYESAARILQEKRLSITAKNIAKELNISGPAITDAIKKHSGKIFNLFERYPTKWILICEYIRPVREIKWQVQAKNA